MFEKKKFSYADQKKQRHHIHWVFIWFFAFFLFYTVFTNLIFSFRVVETEAMQPGLYTGDFLVFSSYTVQSLFSDIDIWTPAPPFRRGNIVVVDTGRLDRKSLVNIILDNFIRFFTAQRVSIDNRGENWYIKRVLGLPGDEIAMTNFVLRIKPRGSQYMFTEYEVAEQSYNVTIPQIPALWDESLPFSGNMDAVVLGEDECFVLSDDRSNTNDSRTWGPIPVDCITGKALFRYWPLTRLGIP
ncbi:MAG: signal peptidase I [Treponema sp.]|jgi:signal peptidase I|nr:signal peptidase I [Treponema sp.]